MKGKDLNKRLRYWKEYNQSNPFDFWRPCSPTEADDFWNNLMYRRRAKTMHIQQTCIEKKDFNKRLKELREINLNNDVKKIWDKHLSIPPNMSVKPREQKIIITHE